MIELKEVGLTYNSTDNNLEVIQNINLTIKKGEFISIVGSSGCGKTTLLKLIGGLLSPTKGSIKINKQDIKKEQKKISFVFQNPTLLPWRTVSENIKLPLEIFKEKKDIVEILKLVNLEEFKDSYPNQLSGGMQQRVNLARAIISNPEILLMDEPFGALDEITRDKLNMELLKIWSQLGITIVLVTHSLSEATFLSDRIIVLTERPIKIREIIDIKIPRPRTPMMKETTKIFEGIEGLKLLFGELFKSNTEKTEICVLGLNHFLKEERFIEFFEFYHKIRRENGLIKVKLILSKDIKKSFIKLHQHMFTEKDQIRFVDFNFPSGIFIFKDHVINIMADKVVTAIDVKSKHNSDRYKQFFHSFWGKK